MRDVYIGRIEQQRPSYERIGPAPFVSTIVKKRAEDQDVGKASIDPDGEVGGLRVPCETP